MSRNIKIAALLPSIALAACAAFPAVSLAQGAHADSQTIESQGAIRIEYTVLEQESEAYAGTSSRLTASSDSMSVKTSDEFPVAAVAGAAACAFAGAAALAARSKVMGHE